jgi:hypothetical protein
MKLGNYWFRFNHRETYNDETFSHETVCAIYATKEAYTNSSEKYWLFAMADGVAECRRSDNFNRATGRKLSLEHALKEAGFDRETRKQIWQEYKDSGAKLN